jgi:hypothetical protein
LRDLTKASVYLAQVRGEKNSIQIHFQPPLLSPAPSNMSTPQGADPPPFRRRKGR